MNLIEALRDEKRFVKRRGNLKFSRYSLGVERFHLVDILSHPAHVPPDRFYADLTITEEDLVADDWETTDGLELLNKVS